jgi:hypothetical protein
VSNFSIEGNIFDISMPKNHNTRPNSFKSSRELWKIAQSSSDGVIHYKSVVLVATGFTN